MGVQRKVHSAGFKAKVALAAHKADRTVKQVIGHARISGVGYFARAYGNKKVEGNLIQLHPVLKIEWLEKPTEEFVAPKADGEKPTAEKK